MVTDINNESLLGAYSHSVHGQQILFIHAGISPKFYQYIKRQLASASSTTNSAVNPLKRIVDLNMNGDTSSIVQEAGTKNNKTVKGELTAEQIAEYTNYILRSTVQQCELSFPCTLFHKEELFGAGPERGGTQIGGPL